MFTMLGMVLFQVMNTESESTGVALLQVTRDEVAQMPPSPRILFLLDCPLYLLIFSCDVENYGNHQYKKKQFCIH